MITEAPPNPLAMRRREVVATSLVPFGCPTFSADPQGWCNFRNRALLERGQGDREWYVEPAGGPAMRFNREWSAENQAGELRKREDERQRFNHRQRNPIGRP